MTQVSKKWKIAFAVIVVLLLIGMVRACSTDDTELGPAQDDYDSAEWVGTVVGTDIEYGSPAVEIDFGDNSPTSIKLAHLMSPDCTDDGAVEASLRARLAELLPAGIAVRVVRQTSGSDDYVSMSLVGGYIYTAAPLVATTTAPTTTTASATPTSTPSPTTTTTTATTTPSPTTTAPVSGPGPGSANEVLLAEGYASIYDPELDFSIAAREPLDKQIDNATRRFGNDGPIFTRLVAASQTAWDTSTGTQAACRVADQPRVDEKLRRDEEDRLRREREEAASAKFWEEQARRDVITAGPDGQLGTADDDRRVYFTDENGNLYTPSQTSSSGGGGGGGGGFICRRSRLC